MLVESAPRAQIQFDSYLRVRSGTHASTATTTSDDSNNNHDDENNNNNNKSSCRPGVKVDQMEMFHLEKRRLLRLRM